jgi:hypothetical protein
VESYIFSIKKQNFDLSYIYSIILVSFFPSISVCSLKEYFSAGERLNCGEISKFQHEIYELRTLTIGGDYSSIFQGPSVQMMNTCTGIFQFHILDWDFF